MAVTLKDIFFHYPDYEDAPVFSGLNLKVEKGEWIALNGAGGCGKSTLLKLIKGILDPVLGEVYIHGMKKEPGILMSRVVYLGSNPENQIVSSIVEDEILFGLQFASVDMDDAVSYADFLLKELGLLSLKYYFTSKLSGGEQQKVLLASHLVLKPSVILLDDALSMVDSDGREKCLQLLKVIQKTTDTSIVMVDHRPQVISWADRVIQMEDIRSFR